MTDADRVTIERETLERALAALGEYERHYGWRIGPTVELRAALAAQPAPAAVPLMDAVLVNAYCKTTGVHQFVQAFVAGARYAESAHGIAAAGDKP